MPPKNARPEHTAPAPAKAAEPAPAPSAPLPPQVERVAITDLIPYANNSRTHSDAQVAKIAASIKEYGWTNPVLVTADNTIIAGHGRVLGARKLGLQDVPVLRLAHLTPAQVKAYVIADNRLALDAGWDDEMLKVELEALKAEGFDLDLTGFNDDELAKLLDGVNDAEGEGDAKGSLIERFLMPPFTVFNARDGAWQDRKRTWIAAGINSLAGRKDSLTFSDGDDFLGQRMEEMGTTSIFDPVLCEILVAWFSPVGGKILDPFAGGSVRGIVSQSLGRFYTGIDLRPEQIEENRAQAEKYFKDGATHPVWITGDSRNLPALVGDLEADMILSCPPYADLEVYSEREGDLSNMDYPAFLAAYREIIAKACAKLKPDGFAAWVIGEVRGKDGNYYNFLGDTIAAFRDAGLEYYNEAVLVTACGSVALRAGRQFAASRKLGKTHQNVLIFVKGDGKRAAKACGVVEVGEAPEAEAVE